VKPVRQKKIQPKILRNMEIFSDDGDSKNKRSINKLTVFSDDGVSKVSGSKLEFFSDDGNSKKNYNKFEIKESNMSKPQIQKRQKKN